MNHRFGGAMLVAAGIVLGCALSSYEGIHAAAAPAEEEEAADVRDPNVADQLKAIRAQLKEINTQLHTGTIKVVVVMNPDQPNR